MSQRPPVLAFLVVMAVVRVMGRSCDAVIVALRRPRLLRLWWRGLMGGPSPFLRGFEAALVAKKAGVAVADLVYGEVFVWPARLVLHSVGVGPGSVVVDLGCGRGAVLVAAASVGAVARGVDVHAAHVDAIADAASAAGVDVKVGDARAVADDVIADADVVWISWITWAEESRRAVSKRLLALRPGAVVIGVGYGVDVNAEGAFDGAFEIVARPRVWCTWGRAELVVCRRR